MKLKDYKYICEVCDKILLNPKANISTIAISYLHVIRQHPIFTRQYEKLLKKSRINFYLYILTFVKLSTLLILYFFKKIFFRLDNLSKFGKFPERTDLVIVSHLINKDYLNFSDDFYFGPVQKRLQQNYKNVLFVFLNHTKANEKHLKEIFNNNVSMPRIVLGKIISFKKEFNNWKLCIKESIKLWKYGNKKTSKNDLVILQNASLEALSFSTFANLRIGEQIKEIVTTFKPKAILTTFEGHAYERIIYGSAREIKQDIKCIAYQHTRVFPYQHAMLRNLGLNYNPDVILTSGKNSCSYIKKLNSNKNITVEILGSPTFYKNDNPKQKENNNSQYLNQNFCIVMPEGIISETLKLFDFILDYSQNSTFTFIFRLHPLISLDKLYKLRPKFGSEQNKNIIISDRKLDNDLKKSKWILYRGSTGVFKAIKEGIIPIYLNASEDEFKIDPLFDLKYKKYQINNGIELDQVFANTNYKNVNVRKSNILFYKKFLHNVYSEFKINTLLKNF